MASHTFVLWRPDIGVFLGRSTINGRTDLNARPTWYPIHNPGTREVVEFETKELATKAAEGFSVGIKPKISTLSRFIELNYSSGGRPK